MTTNKRPAPWTPEENTALVALYFSMLDKATAGQPYNEAAMIRETQGIEKILNPHAPLLSRSKQSIKFKLMNATAAHRDLIKAGDMIPRHIDTMHAYGYPARPNYRATLKDAMRDELNGRAEDKASRVMRT